MLLDSLGLNAIVNKLGFGDSVDFSPIQAADVLAYTTYRWLLNERHLTEEEPYFPIMPAFLKMLHGMMHSADGGAYDLKALHTLVEVVRREEVIPPELRFRPRSA
jgi:hypothetical protein